MGQSKLTGVNGNGNSKLVIKNSNSTFIKRILILCALQSIFLVSFAQEATLIEITGRVTDQNNKEPLPDVSVQVKGTVTGTITNKSGDFKLRTRNKASFYIDHFLRRVPTKRIRSSQSGFQPSDRACYPNNPRKRSGGYRFTRE